MVGTSTIKWSPFSIKHINYINNALNNIMNVAEGAVRSGKTIDNCIIAQMYLETCEDKIHLASGSTLANAKLNIGDCNGFGLEHLFRGRCHWGKYKENDALIINTLTGEKVLIFAGGGKADSYKKILGNSYGLWIATEINEHYDGDDPQTSFIKVAFDRQVASKKMMTLWDLNPSYPMHKIYTDYIDKWAENGLVGGYQYEHFTIEDNLSITEERKKQIISRYEPGSVWYNRNILGMRVVAEGLIYKLFANNPDLFMRDKAVDENGNDINSKGETELKATGITPFFKEVWSIDEEKVEGLYEPDAFYELFVKFYKRVKDKYGKVTHAFADYGALGQVLTFGLNKYLQKERIPLRIDDCIKGEINDRIFLDQSLFAQGRRFLLNKCVYLKEAYQMAQWSQDEPDTRLDDGTTPIDDLDASEYSIFPFYDKLIQGRFE